MSRRHGFVPVLVAPSLFTAAVAAAQVPKDVAKTRAREVKMTCSPARTKLCALALAVSVGAPAFAQESTARLILHSQPGDFVGQGADFDIVYKTPTAMVSADVYRALPTGEPTVLVWSLDQNGPGSTYALIFFGTDQLGIPIQPGFYPDAQRAPFADPGHPGLDVSFQHRGCNTVTGEFTVTEATFGPNNEILTFAATFVQHCEGLGPALFGAFAYNVPLSVSVPIDVRPGSDSNPVNLRSRGVLPVAVVSTDELDVNDLDVDTLRFGDPALVNSGGAPVSPLRCRFQDVSGDGLVDLVLMFSVSELVENGAMGPDSVEGVLTGVLQDGTPFRGTDSVRVVPSQAASPRGRGSAGVARRLVGGQGGVTRQTPQSHGAATNFRHR